MIIEVGTWELLILAAALAWKWLLDSDDGEQGKSFETVGGDTVQAEEDGCDPPNEPLHAVGFRAPRQRGVKP